MAKQYDPRMHTAEHILNQTMIRMFACGRCFSAHIEKKKSKCDYHFDRALDEAEVQEVENRVNRIISDDLPVVEQWIAYDEAQTLFNLKRLPASATEAIRIVSVGQYDACPCIGPHVQSTREIGRFRISSVGFEDGVLRIRFRLDPVSGRHR